MIPHTQRLPLHEEHVKLGAKLGTFGVWEVPLYYTSILDEHQAVRESCGLFDISHMGAVQVTGDNAGAFLEFLVPRNISKIKSGRAAYSFLLNQDGYVLDDIIIYKSSESRFTIIVNADNAKRDFEWMLQHVQDGVNLESLTGKVGILALQGPRSLAAFDALYPEIQAGALPYYGFTEYQGWFIARTGYTGEDGFEIMLPKSDLISLWSRLVYEQSVKPAGFGARDTLRLEAAMPLYGHELTEKLHPLQAGLGWSMDFQKGSFIGSVPLSALTHSTAFPKLVGIILTGKGVLRQGYEVLNDNKVIGTLTSGSFSPTLQKSIGMAYVDPAFSAPGTEIQIRIREQRVPAQIVKLPFYQRTKKSS